MRWQRFRSHFASVARLTFDHAITADFAVGAFDAEHRGAATSARGQEANKQTNNSGARSPRHARQAFETPRREREVSIASGDLSLHKIE